jgi:hypothetical protein
MKCAEARDAMLTADMDELRGDADTALARHIAACAECARIALLITEDAASMNHALMTLSTPVPTRTAAVTSHTRKRLRPPFALAAAAALACIAVSAALMQRELARRAGDAYPLYLPPVVAHAGPVNKTGDGAVAVIRTSNPKITVVWYLTSRRGES